MPAALAVVTGCAEPPILSSPVLPVKHVVVYRNGVAYFERAGQVAAEEVRFKMQQGEVADFLATLAVMERGGSSVRSAVFPLKPVEQDAVGPDGVPLPPTPDQKKGLQTVVLALDGKQHDLQVGYVAESPVWKPSYRLVVHPKGDADLQAWGIVENLSGEDWKDVKLSLVAGAPLAFHADLATPVIPDRPTVTDRGEVIAAIPHAETTLGGWTPPPPPPPESPADAPAAAAPASAADAESGPGGGLGISGVGDGGGGKGEGIGLGRAGQGYGSGRGRLGAGHAVTAPKLREGATSVNGRLPAEVITRIVRQNYGRFRLCYESGLRSNPNLQGRVSVKFVIERSGSVAMTSDAGSDLPDQSVVGCVVRGFGNLSFPQPEGGLVTVVYPISFSPGGDDLSDAISTKPEASPAPAPPPPPAPLAMSTVERDRVIQTHYRMKNGGDTPAKILVKHARDASAHLFQPPPGTEDNVGTGHALVPATVPPGATTELVVDERAAQRQGADWFSAIADNAIKAYMADPKSNATAVQKLTAAWGVRADILKKRSEREGLQRQANELSRASEETRRNLHAIEKNKTAEALRQKLTTRLSDNATKLDNISRRLVELDANLAELGVQFSEGIRDIDVFVPPAGK